MSTEADESGLRVSERVWTIPNVLTFLRIACVPVFLVFVGQERDALAFATLVISGVSDFLDGHIARRYRQVSRLGQIVDPLADRLFILSAVVGLAMRHFVPWWLVVVLVLRDVVGTVVWWQVRRLGYRTVPTHFLGKAATFCLLHAFPLLLLAVIAPAVTAVAAAIGWAFLWWGLALYWVSMIFYVRHVAALPRR